MSLVALAAVVGSVLSAAGPPAGEPARPGVPAVAQVGEAPDAALAVLAANQQGSRVEVVDQRTPNQQVFANPGGTMTTEISAVALRVKRGNEWRAIDTTVVARADGLVEPKAAVGDAVLSGGGSASPLISLHRDGHRLSYYWPAELPKPTLEGNAATYPEVFPGVDLVLRAERNGVAQHLVIKTPKAARNPALAAIRLPIKADGLTVRADRDGSLHAVNGAGAEIFTAPPSSMWDSTGRITTFAVSIVDNVLILAPDQAFLADPATGYPVTVDPTTSTSERHQWATMLSGKATTPYWWTSGDGSSVAQVGQCNNESGGCNGIGEAWTFLQFDTSFLHDKIVHDIVLRATTTYSPSCEWHAHALHGFPIFNGGLTWENGHRLLGGEIARFGAPVVRNLCPEGGGWKSFAIGLNRNYSPNNLSAYILKAVDGGAQRAWRRYKPDDFKISVEWNRAPNAPTDLRTDPPLRDPCRWCGGRSYVGDQKIRLIGTLSDPDNEQVDPQFGVDKTRPDGTAEPTKHIGWGLGFVPSGQPHSTEIDLNNDHDKTITWKLRTGDGTLDVGPWMTSPRQFVVDRKGISAEPGVSSVAYPEDNAWHGGVGVPGEFTFSPGTQCKSPDLVGVCDIDHYLYGWTDPPTIKVDANALGGNATVKLAPPGDGRRTLHVQSVDRAGHATTVTKHYGFYVRAGSGARSQWAMEGNANDTAFLGDRHGTLRGNATYQPGAVGTGVALDGAATSMMSAPNTVRTDASFSVSAWVRLNQHNDAGAVAVEQRGNSEAGFALIYHGQIRRWIFVTPGADVPAAEQPAWHHVETLDPAVLGTWTHLAGTYDSFTRQITLYVNGIPVGTSTRQTPWHAAGAVQVGRIWNGTVDEVQLYDRVLGAAEVKGMVSRDNVQVGHWKFDDKEGTTAENSVEGGESGILNDGAKFIDGGAIGRAVEFNGTSGAVTTTGPAVRTDQSFTVAAWVKAKNLPTNAMTAVGQDGSFNSGFYLQYSGVSGGRWVFLRFLKDADSEPRPPDWHGLAASQLPAAGEWTHLAGTFNAADRKMTIYVNGQKGGETILPTAPWHATGPLTIGRSMFDGNATDYWNGAVDEVRMYSRVLGPEELEGIVSRNNVPAASWELDGDAIDESTNHRDGALIGNPAWTSGQGEHPDPKDLALNLDGVDDYVKATPFVNTTQSYSVSTWVRLDRKSDGWLAVASQTGTRAPAFTFGYNGTGGSGGLPDRWGFTVCGPDKDDCTGNRVSSDVSAQVGVWTHLAAVYQATNRETRLYVNGILSGSGTFAGTPFDARGEFAIGRTKWNGGYGSYFPGAIDDVRVYGRPLFADEVRVMAGRDMSLVHNWRIDEPSGTRVADVVGNRPATLSGGAIRDVGRVGNAVRFNGSGSVSTDRVDVPTDKSFTVTGWVNLDNPGACATVCRSTAVSVDGGTESNSSKFRLGHRIDSNVAQYPGKWIFEMPRRDGRIEEAAISVRPGQFNKWVYLVGVYDAPANQLWLYVYAEGEDEPDFDSGTLTEPWNATGGLRLGGSLRGGQVADAWRGSVDDVRLYTGDLDVDRISKLYASYPASAPSPTTPVPDLGHWKFDENTGAEAKDSSGLGQTAFLRNTAGWHAGGRIGHTSWLDGINGHAETTAAVVNTSQSFSVSAWTHITKSDGVHTIVAQDRNAVSTFMLQYHPARTKWAVIVPTVDGQNPAAELIESTGPARIGLWTHVAMTYDSALRQVRLYVNGLLVGVRVGVSILDSTGPLSIGRSKRNGAKAEFLAGAVDDVQVFGRSLTEGDVRRIHDDAPSVGHGTWSFEGNPNDTSWRRNPTTLSGTPSYVPGVRGQGVQLDGTAASASTAAFGANMLDSFTVSAWAKLSRTDRDATIVGQDGTRTSGFVLQYNKNAGRWIFGAATQDADDAPLVYASSAASPALNTWTHLAGVYDYPARQLRLYVNGELVDIQNDAPLWSTFGAFTIGRGKANGAGAMYFSGVLDEVRTDMGALPAADIAVRATYPAPAGGQLGRFVNASGEHQTVNATSKHNEAFAPVPAGYRFEGPLGQLLAAEEPNTTRLYNCQAGTDMFSSAEPACGGGGAIKIGDLGWAYTVAPAGVPSVRLYACTTGTERFDSLDANCEGKTQLAVLGFTLGYAVLSRYIYGGDGEDYTSVYGAAPGYQRVGSSGLLAMSLVPGTQQLVACRDGFDEFATTDVTCGGKTKVANLGYLWAEPPAGVASKQLHLCQTSTGERLNTHDPACNGHSMLARLGYVLAP